MNKSNTFLLVLISFLISCGRINKHTDKTETEKNFIEYYSMVPLRESPYPVFQGIIRLTKEEALQRNHYRFIYDSQFRLEQVSFWLGNKLRTPNHTANYFFTAPVQKLAYEDNKEIITYYDRFGNPITQRGVSRSIYTKNENGKRIALNFEDNEGKSIENSWGIYSYKWEHQNDGSVIEYRYDKQGNLKSLRPHFEFYIIRLYYEQNGILALMQNIDKAGNLIENNTGVAQDKLLFDNDGRWLGWNVLDEKHRLHKGNGPNVAKGINISNQYGYETSIRYENIDGSPLINSHGFWGSKRFYDKYGNYSYTHFIDSLGNPSRNEQSGYCYAVYTWDEDGYNLLKIALQDINKKPILHKRRGYATIQYQYDAQGNRVKTSYLGLNGELINRKDNDVSYIIYTYNDQHAVNETKHYDKSGNLLNKE